MQAVIEMGQTVYEEEGVVAPTSLTPGRWTRFTLDNSLWSHFPPNLTFSGNYIVFLEGQFQYVGQSMNVGKRLRDHIRMSRYSHSWKTRWGDYHIVMIAVRPEKSSFERMQVEARFINRIHPKHNKMIGRYKR